ncbi:MAG: hypothetical protein KGO96_06900 [Elusimicrobia bacterium]|nr:hypothetical protein [Elusimicrobiota bacterium]
MENFKLTKKIFDEMMATLSNPNKDNKIFCFFNNRRQLYRARGIPIPEISNSQNIKTGRKVAFIFPCKLTKEEKDFFGLHKYNYACLVLVGGIRYVEFKKEI